MTAGNELAAFPGMRGERLLVVDGDALIAAADDADATFDERTALRLRRELWLAEDVLRSDALTGTHLQQRSVHRLAEVRDRPDLVAAEAALSYLRGVGVIAGLLVALALVAFAVARERFRAGALALVGRMGIGRRALAGATAVEISVLAAVGALAGGTAGLLAGRWAAGLADPAPALAPAPLLVVPLGGLLGAVASWPPRWVSPL